MISCQSIIVTKRLRFCGLIFVSVFILSLAYAAPSSSVLASVASELHQTLVEDQEMGVFEKERSLCSSKLMFTADINYLLLDPIIKQGEDEELYVHSTVRNLGVDVLGAYRSKATLCDMVAAELQAVVERMELDLVLEPEVGEDGKIIYNPLFTKIVLLDLAINNPDAPKWVEKWLEQFINTKLEEILSSKMAFEISERIFAKVKDKILH